MKKLSVEIHPAAMIMPMMSKTEFEALKADIKEHGQKEPALLYQGKVLDGRNRVRACDELGIPTDFCEADDNWDIDPIEYVLSINLHRRHLTTSQRSMIAAKMATLKHGGDRKTENIKGSKDLSIKQAASALNTSEKSVKRAKQLIDNGSESLIEAVEQNEIPVTLAAKLATTCDKREQSAMVSKGLKAIREKLKPAKKAGGAAVPVKPSDATGKQSYFKEFKAVWDSADDIGKAAIRAFMLDESVEVVDMFPCPLCKGSGKFAGDPAIPDSLNTKEFQETWALWKDYRKREKKNALKPTTMKLQLAECEKMGPAKAVAALKHSMKQGWTGLFQEKQNGQSRNGKPRTGQGRRFVAGETA